LYYHPPPKTKIESQRSLAEGIPAAKESPPPRPVCFLMFNTIMLSMRCKALSVLLLSSLSGVSRLPLKGYFVTFVTKLSLFYAFFLNTFVLPEF
jgi:hypothetical protein